MSVLIIPRMIDEPFDPSLYTRSPKLNLLSGVTLARALIAACPRGMPGAVQRATLKLGKTAEAAQDAWSDRQRLLAPVLSESGGIDPMADRAFSALRQRLQSYALLASEAFPKAAEAEALERKLFPSGLDFTQLPYVEQLTAMEAFVERIDADRLGPKIDELCGADFLKNVRRIVPLYRSMVQGSLGRNLSPESLSPHNRAMAQAIVEYATRVCATVDSDDPATLERARQALAPIDSLREQTARRSAALAAAVDPAADPLPAPAAGPPA